MTPCMGPCSCMVEKSGKRTWPTDSRHSSVGHGQKFFYKHPLPEHGFILSKKQNFISTLELDGYRHPLGFNISVAMLGRKKAMRDVFDPAIARMIEDGTMEKLAAKSKYTYAKPRRPWVQGHLTMQTILSMR